MTTSPVMGITEELLSVLEAEATASVGAGRSGFVERVTGFSVIDLVAEVRRLRSAIDQQPTPAAPVAQEAARIAGYRVDGKLFTTWGEAQALVRTGRTCSGRVEPLYAAPPAAGQLGTVSDLGLRHTAPWDSARVGDYNAGWNDRHMAGMRDGEQPDTVKVDHRNIAELLLSIGWKDSSDAQWDRLRNAIPELRALLAGGAE